MFCNALVACCAVLPLFVHHNAWVRWREREVFQRGQAERLAELSAENERLSNLVAHTRNSILSTGEFRELLKLRGEIGQLRESASEVRRLRAAQELPAAGPANETQSGPLLPDPQTVLAHWQKEQLTSLGYDGPTQALQTALWAMSRADPNALAASVTPWTSNELAGGLWVAADSNEVMAAQSRLAAEFLSLSSGFYVSPSSGSYSVEQELSHPDQAFLDVYFEGEGTTRQVELEKVGEEWKVSAINAYHIFRTTDGTPRNSSLKVWP
jgi:hypothetical protein